MSSDTPGIGLLALAALLLVAGFGVGATCGGLASDDVSCFLDEDCQGEELCVRGFCRPLCGEGRSCEGDENCKQIQRPSERDLVDVCLAPDEGLNTGAEACSSDEACRSALDNPNAACSVGGVCYVPQGVWGVLIRDTTMVDLSSDPPAEPVDGGLGADIAALYLADEAGAVLLPGDTLVYAPVNGVDAESTIEGAPPQLSADGQCVEGDAASAATPLGGEGGMLLARFLDTSNPEALGSPEQWTVVVIEWGSQCTEGDDADTYEVFLCFAPSYESMGPENCQRRLSAPMSGRGEFRPGEL